MSYCAWRSADSGFIVRIDWTVLQGLALYRQKLGEHQPESLGLLVGQVWERAFWVKAFTTPNLLDKRSRFSCERSAESAKLNYQILKNLNKQSGYQYHYLGEWHTHPENEPQPSLLDYIGWASLPKNVYFNRNIRLFLILGAKTQASDWLSVNIDGVFYDLILENETK